jgi:hypothetical protein
VERQSGPRMTALMVFVTHACPFETSPGGCSLTSCDGVIHETAGRLPLPAARRKWLYGAMFRSW